MQDYTQLGVSGVTLAILFFIVRYFTVVITKKDEQIQEMIKSFNTTVNNHIHHSNDSMTNLAKAIKDLTKGLSVTRKK